MNVYQKVLKLVTNGQMEEFLAFSHKPLILLYCHIFKVLIACFYCMFNFSCAAFWRNGE